MAQGKTQIWLNLGPNIIMYTDHEGTFDMEAVNDTIDVPNSEEITNDTEYEQEFDSLFDNEDFSLDEQYETNISVSTGISINNIFTPEINEEITKNVSKDDIEESSVDYEEWSSDEDNNNECLYNTNADIGIIVYRLNNKKCFGDKEHPEAKISQWIDELNRKADFIHTNCPDELVMKEEYYHDLTRVCDPYISNEDPFFKKNIIEIIDATSNSAIEKVNGNCLVKMKNGDELHGNWRRGKREGVGGISGARLEKMNISMITGKYISGVLTGLGKIIMKNEAVHEGWFHQGFLHGPVKGTVREEGTSGRSILCWVGWYIAGLAVGTCWSSLPGDGWLVGKVDYNGKFTGNRIAFIYPDLSTALVGKFSDGVLVSAVPGKIVSISKINDITIPEIKMTSNEEYRYWRSSRDEIMCPPHRKDVYEQQFVTVGKSTMPESGEGLFAKVNIPERTLITYYNGIILEPDDPDPYTGENATGYSIMVESLKPWMKEKVESDHMDILPKYQSYEEYSASSAHKLNHSFSPNCEWADAVHPCYGRIPAVRTIRDISLGEELFIHYMIDMDGAKQWYKDVWDNFSLKNDKN